MSELLKANIWADVTFYRRSKLLLAFMLVFLLMTALQSLPPLFMNSGVQSFNSLQQIVSDLNFFLLALAGGMGLLVISSHLRNRSLKMVFTKPCPPATWLLSAYLAAAAMSLFLNLVVLGSGVLLSFLWHLPVRTGLVFISAETFAVSLGLIAYLMMLATVMHPALAAIVALIFNADLFNWFDVWTKAAIQSGNSSFALRMVERLFHFLYFLLPMVYPFDKQTQNIHISLRVLSSEWKYLPFSLGYTLVLSAFCYCVSLFALKKKNHI
jgi:ABC-type transport system involved in multi-copper enzyme maturation permease subunit